ALAALTDSALAGDVRGATVAAVLVVVAVIAALTAGHFAHIFYFELGDRAVPRLERELIEMTNGSAGLEHHERPEYADNKQLLRQELHRAGWGSMEGLMNSLGLLVAISITAILLARPNPLLLLLPLPPGRRCCSGGGRSQRRTRAVRHRCPGTPSTCLNSSRTRLGQGAARQRAAVGAALAPAPGLGRGVGTAVAR
ncbi:hypothetical protein K7G98_23695, partial [Saccharothrix sp. MB29]|nr:hypothetical protein [Saccharothrix sp. MB29]